MNNTHRLITIFSLICLIKRIFSFFNAFSYWFVRFKTRMIRSMIYLFAFLRIFNSFFREVKLIILFLIFLIFIFWLRSSSIFHLSYDSFARSICSRLFWRISFLSSWSSFNVDKKTFKCKLRNAYFASW
jgi:hypothetical protein